MKPVLTRATMRAFDAHLIDTCHVPGVLLMENAGSGATDVIVRDALGGEARGKRVVLVCGTGNNGGDGFVVARHLATRGAAVAVFCTDPTRVKGDAKVNADAFTGVGGVVRALGPTGDGEELTAEIARADAVVDALFGTGLDRPLTAGTVATIDAVNLARSPRVAIDVPSGVDADTGATLGASSVRADHTVTFAHPKQGLLTPRGVVATGVLHVVDLGVPAALGPALEARTWLLEPSDVAHMLKARGADAHKNAEGHVAVFAGSGGKVGAALMVAHAALRAGAGVATIATWDEAAAVARGRVTEVMVAGLDRADVKKGVNETLHGKTVVVCGPGFGTDVSAREAVEILLSNWKGPLLFDADALTLFADRPEGLKRSAAPCVLTPHSGEAARLLGSNAAAVEADRYAAARSLASRAGAVVVLKGACTLIADPDGRVVVNPAANPALATAGSGDTLAGIVGGLLASLTPFDAACAGVFIHAAVAEGWSREHGDRGLLASEIADGVPDALFALRDHAR